MLFLYEKNNIYMFFCIEYGLIKFIRGYIEYSFKCFYIDFDYVYCYIGKLFCYLLFVCGYFR